MRGDVGNFELTTRKNYLFVIQTDKFPDFIYFAKEGHRDDRKWVVAIERLSKFGERFIVCNEEDIL